MTPGRIDFHDDPAAPPATRIVPSVNVAVTNEAGELLLIRRSDNEKWALPGGAVDLGESLAQAGVRETREESGIECEVTGLSQPDDVVALYPRRDAIPGQAWVRLLGSATREIAILGRDGSFPAAIPGVLDVLGERARAGVRVRVCLRDPEVPPVDDGAVGGDGDGGGALPGTGAGAVGLYTPLRQRGDVQVRLHRDYPYNDMCLADDAVLVLHRVYGVPAGQCPVLQLHRSGDSAVFATYLAAFERLWDEARDQLSGSA